MRNKFDAALAQIDHCLSTGHLKEASRLMATAERFAISEASRKTLIERILLHGLLAGQFDTTDKLFSEQLLKYPQDINLKKKHDLLCQIAGWRPTHPNASSFTTSSLALQIQDKLTLFIESNVSWDLLEELNSLSLSIISDVSLVTIFAEWDHLEETINFLGERILPYRLEALLGEAWLADPYRGEYSRLAYLDSVFCNTKSATAFADVVSFLHVLQSISCWEPIKARLFLTQLLSSHSPWLWLRLVDFVAYFGTPQHWKQVCRWMHSQQTRQETEEIRGQFSLLLCAFSGVVLTSIQSADHSLTQKDLLLLESLAIQKEIDALWIWKAQTTTSPVVCRLFAESNFEQGKLPNWTKTLPQPLETAWLFLRAIYRRDLLALSSTWNELSESFQKRPEFKNLVQQMASDIVGDDAPPMPIDFWLKTLLLLCPLQPEHLSPLLSELAPSLDKEWLLSWCIISLAASEPKKCRHWLKHRQQDFSEAGWQSLIETLSSLDPSWRLEAEEINLAADTKAYLRNLEKMISAGTCDPYQLAAFVKIVPAKNYLIPSVWRLLGQLLSPPLFLPAFFVHWYKVAQVRQHWNTLPSATRQAALDSLDQQCHTSVCRLLEAPLRPLLIDVPNVMLNEQVRGLGNDPFNVLERIWAAVWDQDFYPILTYADASFWRNYTGSEATQNHLDRLKLGNKIQVAGATGNEQSTADYQILSAIEEGQWQNIALILTGDNYTKAQDSWTQKFPWLRDRFRKMQMNFSLNVKGHLVLRSSDGQQFDVP